MNGTPRAGKSSIAHAVQRELDGVWMNLGVDHFKAATPERFQPGVGLRPGGERPDLEPLIQRLYHAMYASLAAHSRAGLNVVADVVHHDAYSRPLGIRPSCAKLLRGLPTLVVGVRCPLEEVLTRRERTWESGRDANGEALAPVLRWQQAVHDPRIYDLEVDTSQLSPEQSAALIAQRLRQRNEAAADSARIPSAIDRWAALPVPV